MKKTTKIALIIITILLMLLYVQSAFAVSVSRGSSFSSGARSSSFSSSRSSSFSSSKSSYTSTKPTTNAGSSYSYSSFRSYSAPVQSSPSFFNATNLLLLGSMYQNHLQSNDIARIQESINNGGYVLNNGVKEWYYNPLGFDKNGFTPAGKWWYSEDGCDVNGFSKDGSWCYNKSGYDINGFDRAGNKIK